jgi:MSHA biogenesis protein MshE
MKLDLVHEYPAVQRAAASARVRDKLRLGDLLVAQGVITPAQLQVALAEQKRSSRRLGRILIDDSMATEQSIASALAQQLRLPFVDLTLDLIDLPTAKLLTETQARRYRSLPISQLSGVVRLAVADPTDFQSLDDVERLIGLEIEPVVVTETRLHAALDRLHVKNDEILGLAKELELEMRAEFTNATPAPASANAQVDEAPVAKLLASLFEDALRGRASDIHVEPQERKLQIRFRVDGALMLHTEAESRIAPAVVQRLKLMAGLDIAERRLPQDGRFNAKVRGQSVDIRISTMPTQYGESAVLRLLSQNSQFLALDKLGMPAGVASRVREFVRQAQGMLLVTGPTGSGKTTTLYGALATINSPQNKIITVEDPVEYRLPGINQVQVNEKIGLSFATVLRSTLRQDPDIVLVGEMRDRETVDTGLRAAMTGHMVLSTLHTNDAASTPTRLLDMGAPRYLVATSLRLVLAQRLVRAVCPECAQPHAPTPQESALLNSVVPGAGFSGLRHGMGCANCNGSGYAGRLGVYELLEMTPEVVTALASEDTVAYMSAARKQIGELSLARHVCDLALAGKTTPREAMRLIGTVGEIGENAEPAETADVDPQSKPLAP